ncbi:MAG: GNAT family N-acetyltransferase [Bacteroidota bacterium]
MQVIEVLDKKTKKDFHQVPKVLYKNDPWWVCPLDSEIEGKFNPDQNAAFKDGEAKRWVLKENGQLIGRVAAFYNAKKAAEFEQPTGGLGFFECINNQDAANLLFDTARDWLKSKGMEAMDGPVNFGENDSFWGLLVEGFTHPGYGMPYNYPYYKDLFSNYGFKLFFEQYSYHLDLNKKFPERFWKIAEWVSKKPGFSFRHFTWKEKEKFVNDMTYIYNKAWAQFKEDYTPLDTKTIYATISKAKPIIDGELVWFAYHNDEPIAFFIMFPDVNQILKKLDGKINLWNIIKFLYYKRRKEITRIRALVAGVIPKFQNSGI